MSNKLTPRETVRAYCMHCLGMKQLNADEVKNCQGDAVKCPFFNYRMGKRTPVRVFRAFCIDCMGGKARLVKDCPATSCEVFPYRMGKNPALTGQVRGASLMKKIVKDESGEVKKRQESIFSGQDIWSIVST